MSEFRQNIVTQEWVIIAPERGEKPKVLKTEKVKGIIKEEYSPECPFCAGNEKKYDIVETYRLETAGRSWSVRAIENKYKTLAAEETCPARLSKFDKEGIYMKYKGCGQHEVIVDTPVHNKIIALMSIEEIKNVISIYQARFNSFSENPNNLISIIFKNSGLQAGASQPHSHSQIVGSRIVPLDIRYMLIEAQRYFDRTGNCVVCEMMEHEEREAKRVVYKNNTFTGLIPYAAGVMHETWIIPKDHKVFFGSMDDDKKADFADIIKKILMSLYKTLDNPDYNFIIYNAPYPFTGVPFFHWYLRIVPRFSAVGGFSVGTKINVNPVYPEKSAELLRREID